MDDCIKCFCPKSLSKYCCIVFCQYYVESKKYIQLNADVLCVLSFAVSTPILMLCYLQKPSVIDLSICLQLGVGHYQFNNWLQQKEPGGNY